MCQYRANEGTPYVTGRSKHLDVAISQRRICGFVGRRTIHAARLGGFCWDGGSHVAGSIRFALCAAAPGETLWLSVSKSMRKLISMPYMAAHGQAVPDGGELDQPIGVSAAAISVCTSEGVSRRGRGRDEDGRREV